jgi:hypothetical protein
MRIGPLLLTALLLGAGRPASDPLSDGDFHELMTAAVEAASVPRDLQPLTSTICIERQLGPALDVEKHLGNSHLPVGVPDIDRSLDDAMSSEAAVARQDRMPKLARKYVLVNSGALPPKCVISHTLGRGPGWEHNESIVILAFTRPALANGYAFIEESEQCAGLCGTVYLRIFRHQNGHWSQVERTILAVS